VTVATTLASHAVPVPSAIRVNMLSERRSTDCTPRTKNGQPAHSTTGVANSSSSQGTQACGRAKTWPPMSSATTGAASAAPVQRRRVMSTSSSFGPRSSETSSGSSAMPQIGQLPGPTCRTSGCIGQV
jgi:hypothetical protein